MNHLLKTIAAISETHNPSLKINVVTTMFDNRQNLDKIIRQQVENQEPTQCRQPSEKPQPRGCAARDRQESRR